MLNYFKNIISQFNLSIVQPFNLLVFILLILLPLLGGGNYLFQISPLWGNGLLLILITLVLFFLIFIVNKNNRLPLFPLVDGFFLAFIFFLTFSYLYSKNRSESLAYLLSLWGSVSLGLVIRIFLKDIQSIEKSAKVIVFSSLPVILYQLYQSIWEFRFIVKSVTEDQTLRSLRSHFEFHRTPFSTFMTSNAFACYLVMVIPLIIYFFIIEKEGRKKNYWGSLFILVSFAIFLTGSKGGLMTYFILIVSGMILLSKIRKEMVFAIIKQIMVFVLVSFILTLLFWKIEWKPPGQNTVENEAASFTLTSEKLENSAQGRLHYWNTAFNMWKEHWIIGAGIGTYATLSPRYQENAFYARHVHNDYLEMLAETGIIGLTLFLGFLISFFIQSIKTYDRTQKEIQSQISDLEKFRVLLLEGCLTLGILAFLIHSAIDFNWEITANRSLFFIFLMMSLSLFGFVSKSLPDTKGVRYFEVKIGNPVLSGGVLLLLIIQGILIPKVTLAESYFELATDPFEKNLSKSIDFAESAVELLPSHYKYHLFLAEAYRKRGYQQKNRDDLEWAFKEGEIALRLQPEISETHGEMAILYALKGQTADVETGWKEAIIRSREKISFYNRLGAFYLEQKELQKARSVLEEGLSLEKDYLLANHPDMLEVMDGHLMLARLFEIMTQNSNAVSEYERVLVLLKAYPNLNSVGHWNFIEPDYSSNLEAYAKMNIGKLAK